MLEESGKVGPIGVHGGKPDLRDTQVYESTAYPDQIFSPGPARRSCEIRAVTTCPRTTIPVPAALNP